MEFQASAMLCEQPKESKMGIGLSVSRDTNES